MPLRERLAIAEDMLKDHQEQLTRLLDLYVAGDFPKDVLVDRKNRLEEAIKALEKERANIISMLEKGSTQKYYQNREKATKPEPQIPPPFTECHGLLLQVLLNLKH